MSVQVTNEGGKFRVAAILTPEEKLKAAATERLALQVKLEQSEKRNAQLQDDQLFILEVLVENGLI